ncbi:protein of unknown function [Paraburkholderia kururiensis]
MFKSVRGADVESCLIAHCHAVCCVMHQKMGRLALCNGHLHEGIWECAVMLWRSDEFFNFKLNLLCISFGGFKKKVECRILFFK